MFLEARAKCEMCQSKLKFIGFNDSALKLNDLANLENNIRSKVVFEESQLTVDYISEARSTFTEIRKSFFTS